MSDVIISVEGLGKKYRISHQGERQRYVALRDVIAEKAKQLFSRGQKTEERGQRSAIRDQTSDLQIGPRRTAALRRAARCHRGKSQTAILKRSEDGRKRSAISDQRSDFRSPTSDLRFRSDLRPPTSDLRKVFRRFLGFEGRFLRGQAGRRSGHHRTERGGEEHTAENLEPAGP